MRQHSIYIVMYLAALVAKAAPVPSPTTVAPSDAPLQSAHNGHEHPTENPPAPKLVCLAATFDFGERDNSQSIEHEFVIQNEGETTLEIIRAKPSCGCTVASISSKQIAPGKSATIAAKLDLKGKEGRQHKTITVESNDPEKSKTILAIKGTAIATVSVSPSSIIVPNYDPRATDTKRITIVARDDHPLAINDLTTGNPHIFAETVPLKGKNGVEIQITMTSNLTEKVINGRITAKTTHPKKPDISVPYRFTLLGEISVYPEKIQMVSQKQAVTRFISLSPGKVKKFAIEKVALPDADMKASVQNLKNNRYRIVISNIMPTADLDGKKVTIHTTAPTMKLVSVPFKIIARNVK